MKQQVRVKNFGNTTIVETEKGLEVHASPNMHEGSANRLFKSKRFKRLPKGREVVKEGIDKVLVSKRYRSFLKSRDWFWYCPNLETGTFYKCIYVTPKCCKNINSGRLHSIGWDTFVLCEDTQNFLFTQKTSNMATAKKAAPKKKVAVKAKAKGKSAGKKEGGPGKIEQIIALHKQGLSNKEIEAKGFNYTTISIQVAKYKKAHGKGKK
jgi:hypothetical protein